MARAYHTKRVKAKTGSLSLLHDAIDVAERFPTDLKLQQLG